MPRFRDLVRPMLILFLTLVAHEAKAYRYVVCTDREDLEAGLDTVTDLKHYFSDDWMPVFKSCSSELFPRSVRASYIDIYEASTGHIYSLGMMKLPKTDEAVFTAGTFFPSGEWRVNQGESVKTISPMSCEVFEAYTPMKVWFIKHHSRKFPIYIKIPRHCTGNPVVDAKLIAEHLVTAEIRKNIHSYISRIYVQQLTDILDTHSVKVIDEEKFAILLPEHLSNPWIKKLEDKIFNRLIILEPSRLSDLLDHLKNLKSERHFDETNIQDFAKFLSALLEAQVNQMTGIQDEEASINDLKFASYPFKFIVDIDVTAELYTPYMANILETNGVFKFPNPVLEKSLIQDVRAANP